VARSLRGRLGFALGLTAALSLIASAVLTFGLVRRFAQQQAISDLRRVAEATAAEASSDASLEPARLRPLRRIAEATGNYFAVVGPRGGVSGGEPLAIAIGEAVDVGPALEGRTADGTVTLSGQKYAYIVVPVRPKDRPAGPLRAVILARRVSLPREVWLPILWRVVLAAGLAAVVATIVAALWARRLARPVQQVASATARVASGDLLTRVPVEGSDELTELSRSFNMMASGLEEARRREGEFLASVSHELRTPITAIRGYVEALDEGAVRDAAGRREAIRVIKIETVRLERLVSDVMDLARAGAHGFRLEIRDTDVAEVLRDAAAAHATESAEAGVTIEVAAEGTLGCRTDPGRVRQVVTNLVENAVRVSPRNGIVRLAGRSLPDRVVIDVTDDGPGIAAEHIPHVFERTYLRNVAANGEAVTPEPGRLAAGSGLGLAIVRELVRALGGEVRVASEPGRGTTFSVALPTG
jgi:two-component system sensor histidine kinase BaeS